jgi:hypothetical protein
MWQKKERIMTEEKKCAIGDSNAAHDSSVLSAVTVFSIKNNEKDSL